MKLTQKQQNERENLEWFAPSLKRFGQPSDETFNEYLAHSERGIPMMSKFNFYAEAKRLRGIQIHELWESDFYKQDGSWLGYDALLKEEDSSLIPRHIAEFIAKEIFAGQDRDKIMAHYEEIKP